MAILSRNFKIWLRGLIAAAISAFATAGTGAIALPTVFNFSHDGLINILKITVVPTIAAVFAYLQKSPIPAPDTVTIEQQETHSDGSQVSTVATMTKSPENGQS